MIDLDLARRNAVLAALPADDLQTMAQTLQQVKLTRGDVLYEAGKPASAVHFPLVGVVSLVQQMDGSDTVEIATVGFEGMIGMSVFFGVTAPTERAFVQVPGEALTMSSDAFRGELAVLDGPLQDVMRRYTQAMFAQIGRNAACNQVHSVQRRAARWLLMTGDRMRSNQFDLTQEFLSQMLGVRRATVSEIAQQLADDGSITYTRGRITITDRNRLHHTACECYDIITRATTDALAGPGSH